MDEEQYKKELADAGVELPETEPEPAKEPAEDAPAETPKAEPVKEEPAPEKKEEPAPLPDEPKEQRKRSIYDEYKEKKAELKSEKEQREALEKENAELRQKVEAVGKAETPEEKQEAADELEAFAKEINADPATLNKLRTLILKDVKPATDEALAKDIEEFKQWRTANAQAIEKSAFESEFTQATPKLKEILPNASPEEMEAIKTELDKLSHTKEWHDKSLAYIAFENKDTLSALISPKKRGMESNNRKQDDESLSPEFDPNADYSKMSLKEREQWEAQYAALGKTDGLMTGANGKKMIL